MTQTVIRIGSTIKSPPRMRAWMLCQTLRNAVGADLAWGPGTPGGPGTAVDLVSIRVCPERPGSPTGLVQAQGTWLRTGSVCRAAAAGAPDTCWHAGTLP